jgi:hypothetical protein
VVQLNILSGKKAGTEWVARRFPVYVGRSAQDSLVLDDPGVWDRHFKIDVRAGEGAVLAAAGDALTILNGHATRESALRNGDTIEAGSVKLRFGLSPTRQSSLGFREWMTWIGLGALCLGQVALVYWLTQ